MRYICLLILMPFIILSQKTKRDQINLPDKLCTKTCKRGYQCQVDRCIRANRCSKVKCVQGFYCSRGLCIEDPCLKCKQSQVCDYKRKRKCIDKCKISCGQDSVCKQGQCIKTCSTDDQCRSTDVCKNGLCYNACSQKDCKNASVCIHGNCLQFPRKCNMQKDCKDGQKCSYNYCVDSCLGISCPGKNCVNGQCVDRKCVNDESCPQNSECVNNICEPIIQTCPKSQNYTVKSCTEPRPNQQNCPMVFSFRDIEPKFRGVKADGSRASFAVQCSVCKNNKILYYFDQPCHRAPFVCNEGENCAGYYCSKNECQNSQDCPFDWQSCIKGKCLDSCANKTCPNCKYGQCNFLEPSGKCISGPQSQCKNQKWICISKQCADLCYRTRCPANQKCNLGICSPIIY